MLSHQQQAHSSPWLSWVLQRTRYRAKGSARPPGLSPSPEGGRALTCLEAQLSAPTPLDRNTGWHEDTGQEMLPVVQGMGKRP